MFLEERKKENNPFLFTDAAFVYYSFSTTADIIIKPLLTPKPVKKQIQTDVTSLLFTIDRYMCFFQFNRINAVCIYIGTFFVHTAERNSNVKYFFVFDKPEHPFQISIYDRLRY